MTGLSEVAGVFLIVQAPPPTGELPLFRIVVRAAIAILIAAFLCYIVIEQVGSWRRRRSRRD